MKKVLFSLAAIGILAITATSCKKDDNKNTTTSLTKAWKVNDKKYDQLASMGMNAGEAYMFMAVAEMPGSGNSEVDRVLIHFKSKPSSDGSYKIVYKPELSDLLSDEVYILVGQKSEDLESVAITEGNEGKMLTVKLENGKMNVTFPKVTALRGPGNDSHNEQVTIEGNIVEQ